MLFGFFERAASLGVSGQNRDFFTGYTVVNPHAFPVRYEAWLSGRVENLAPMVHPEIVVVIPGFAGRIQGRERFLPGFRDFCENATIHEFHEQDQQVDTAGDTAVVTFRYDMTYDRSGQRYRTTGRELWVFQKEAKGWTAVWRAMLELEENAA